MTFCKIDHKILTDPRTEDLSDAVFTLFVKLIIWSSREETDGVIPSRVRCKFGSLLSLRRLESVGLVSLGRGEVIVTNYLKHQRSKEEIEGKRQSAKDRVTRYRQNQRTENREQIAEDRVQRTDIPPTPKAKQKPKPKALSWKFVPCTWTPKPSHIAKATKLNVDFNKELEKFRDWEFKSPKTDADRAFSTWLGNADPQQPRQSGFRTGTTTPQQAQLDRQMERIRQAEAEEKADTKPYPIFSNTRTKIS